MASWQSVFKAGLEYQAQIVKNVLEENNIEAVILNKKDSPYGIGHLEVQVHADQVIGALKIIEEAVSFG